ncbi:MAG: thioredoxin family protein [Bacteroidales bacterium]|nr:thioredoxin family protein [Bacteroidales bacterium]
MPENIISLSDFQEIIQINTAVLIYFSHEQCNVCKVLKPKIYNMLSENFPKIKMYYSDTVLYPEIAAQNSIFTVPTIIIYLDSKEFVRKSRNIGIEELKSELERPYDLLFS